MYRAITMLEITEVLRIWRGGVPRKRIAARLELDPKTVRRYVMVAEGQGIDRAAGALSDEQLRAVLAALHPGGGRPRGDGWVQSRAHQTRTEQWLAQNIRLTKIRKLLTREGVPLASPTLHRLPSSSSILGGPPRDRAASLPLLS